MGESMGEKAYVLLSFPVFSGLTPFMSFRSVFSRHLPREAFPDPPTVKQYFSLSCSSASNPALLSLKHLLLLLLCLFPLH